MQGEQPGGRSESDRLTKALADRYRIESELGQGGMATVYLAEDLKHKRMVALKVLRPELAAALGSDRFLREIEVAAGLHHPHILPLYDSGEADGFLFYTMPYVQGQSLRDRLEQEGELPVQQVVRLLHDVVDALSHAHQNGLVHRDIKPENVMIAGRHALVTDFGVAKALGEAGKRDRLTSIGIALGTPLYMAPEQAAADPQVDHRADIYACGMLGYELLTGRTAFAGLSPQAILAAHMTQAPQPVKELRPTVPPVLASLIMRCLEKKPADRFQSAEEMLPVLEALATPSGGTTPLAVLGGVAATTPWRRRLYVAGGGAVLAALAWIGWRVTRPQGPPITITNVRQLTHQREPAIHVAVSPDGREVVYELGYPGQTHIEIRDLAGGRPVPLTADWTGPRGQAFPSWSPDGRSIHFLNVRGSPAQAAGRWMMPRLGGEAVRPDSAELASLHGGVHLVQRGDTLVAVAAQGTETVIRIGAAHSMSWRRDGSAVAYVVGNESAAFQWGAVAPSQIWVTPIGGAPALVTDSTSSNTSPEWMPDGTLLFVSNRDGARDIYAVRLDRSGQPREPPVRLTTGLEAYSISVSDDGTTAAYDRFTLRRNIYVIPIPDSGTVSVKDARQLTTGNQVIQNVSLSADGSWLAFDSNLQGNQDIYIMPATGSEPRLVTRDPNDDFGPSFSPTGRQLAYFSIRDGVGDIYVINTDGTGERRLTSGVEDSDHPYFSPDGLRIAYSAFTGEGPTVRILRRESVDAPWGTPEPTPLDQGYAPQWSPDGSALVVEDGRAPLLINQSAGALWIYPLGGEKRTLFAGGTEEIWVPKWPLWSPDGSRVYFRAFQSDGTEGLFEIPPSGGSPRHLMRFDDPSKPVYEGALPVGNGLVYMVIGELESDIYVMNLVKK